MTSSSTKSIRVGSYQLGSRLGEGGVAEVYRARDASGREVALKLLGPHAELDDERARDRFLREIELAGSIEHPHLARLLDSGIDDELGPYLVTELVPGPSLRARIEAAGPDAACLVLEPVARAAAALHRAGLVHRDLKPENVVVTAAGHVALVDLGLARRPGQSRHTEEGEVVGSVPYMAPEQIEGADVGPAADVWALGVMLYELCCGVRPFARTRPREEAAAILVAEHEPLGRRDGRAGAALSALIDRCLARDPARRPGAEELAERLAAELDWCAAGERAAERAAWFAGELAPRVAAHRVAQLAEAARAATGSGDAFAALGIVDRALAYAPNDPGLRALAERAGEARPAPPPQRRRTWLWWAAAVAAAVAVAFAAALADPGGDATLLAGVQVPEPPPRSVDLPVLPGGNASDRAAGRVVSGMGQLIMRGLAGERRADGTIVARQGGPGEASNEQLTADVFGGMLDLFEQGIEAKTKRAAALSFPALDEARLGDRDRPRHPESLRAAPGAPLLELEGKTAAQIDILAREIARRRESAPDDPHLALTAVIFDYARGRAAAADRALAALVERRPDFADARVIRGHVASRRGDQKAALAALGRALEIAPGDAHALATRGRILYRLGKTRSAYRDLLAAVRADPGSVDGFAGLAELYAAVRGPDAAEPLLARLRALTADEAAGAKAARRINELCAAGVAAACR